MIGIKEGVSDNSPGQIPSQVFFVDKDTHQFRDGEGRMRLRNSQYYGKKYNEWLTSLS